MTDTTSGAPAPRHAWIDEALVWTAAALAISALLANTPTAPTPLAKLHLRPALRPWAGKAPPPGAPAPHPRPFLAVQDPVRGYPVISPFGLRQLPWEQAGRLHRGVDIAAPGGTPVLAASDGVVAAKGVDAGYGRFIELRHAGGLTTLYGHLDRFRVSPGDAVRAGDVVGLMGSTGSSTGSHLHFEVHDPDGRPLNPELFLGKSFASPADLPIRQALRLPRGLRVAYVSFIPAGKRDAMAERQAEEAARQVEAHPVALREPAAAAPPPALAAPAATGADAIGEILRHAPAEAPAAHRVHSRIFPYG